MSEKLTLSKIILLVDITAIVTALVVGGGVYWWQSSITEESEMMKQQQIEDLQNQLDQAMTEIEDLQNQLDQAMAEQAELEQRYCTGTWINGVCVHRTCVDSDVNEKPDDIYIKGSVTFTDQYGVSTTVHDECSYARTQVNEMWCYESPEGSGNYVPGEMVYNCPNGCFDGACLRTE